MRSGERCVFVSQVAAERLRDLAHDSRRLSFEEFLAEDLKGGRDREFDYCTHEWTETDNEAVYGLLQLVSVETISEPLLEDLVTVRLQVLVRGHPNDARRVLAELAEKSMHLDLTASEGQGALEAE
ncbi:MAG: hypothetical protein ACRDZO_15605 [Egibacteraceae bacterium]